MKILLAISITAFLIACGPDPERNGNSGNSSSSQQTKSYTVTTDGGKSCNVMIRQTTYGFFAEYTLSCPRNTKIGCFRIYDSSKFILATESGYVSASNYGLIASDGYGNGIIDIGENKNFNSIASVSLHETSCN